MSEQNRGPSGIKIVDRRRFTAEGDTRAEAASIADPVKPPSPPPAVPKAAPAASASVAAAAGSQAAPAAGGQAAAGPSALLQFIAQLATTAMAAMGVLPPAQSRGVPVNFQMAQDYLEIIAMLQERTRGNLTVEEDTTLQSILIDLRLQFVDVTQPPPPGLPGMPPPGLPGMPPGMAPPGGRR